MDSSIFFSGQSDPTPAEKSHVVVCVGCSEHAARVLPHAYAIAGALGMPVTLLQVLEAKPAHVGRPDPIEWDLRRHEAQFMLRGLAQHPEPSAGVAGIHLAEGLIANEIIRFTNGQRGNLLVLGTQSEHGARKHCIGGMVSDVLDHAMDSVLLVPTSVTTETPYYQRILVPLDGSPQAESILPLAVRVARATHAELILAHVVPGPELTEPYPLEPEDLELRQRVLERNEVTARHYLDRLRRHLCAQGLHVRVVVKHGDNICTSLAQTVAAEGTNLVIMSARGHGDCCHEDLRYGHVASYLMSHATMPVLVARPKTALIDADPVLIADHNFSRMPMGSRDEV
jgi:nucleotide-binding universal stress UspA family protein